MKSDDVHSHVLLLILGLSKHLLLTVRTKTKEGIQVLRGQHSIRDTVLSSIETSLKSMMWADRLVNLSIFVTPEILKSTAPENLLRFFLLQKLIRDSLNDSLHLIKPLLH